MTPAILPFVHAQGSWGDIGLQVGQMCCRAIGFRGSPYATYTLATCQTGALSVTVRDRFQPAVPA